MKAFYINLDRATERRANLERSFVNCGNANWQLSRFKAIDASECAAVSGRIRPAEKACFLSHVAVIAKQKGISDNFLVLEDDACFAPETFTTLDRILGTMGGAEWDILFTDLTVGHASAMAWLAILRNELKPFGRVIALDLKRLPGLSFAGAMAYLVNHRSVDKLLALSKPQSLDIPYDLFLKSLIVSGEIKAHATFPFLTTTINDASGSQIQKTSIKNRILETFRRMVWIRGDEFDPSGDLEIIKKDLNMRSLDYGILLASMIDPSVPGV